MLDAHKALLIVGTYHVQVQNLDGSGDELLQKDACEVLTDLGRT
jgi:hypothetical protein